MKYFISSIAPITVLAALALLAHPTPAPAALKPVALRCEYRVNPLGIDETEPRLTWRVESPERGERQTAYQILVASSEALLGQNKGDLWDSGKVASDDLTKLEGVGPKIAAALKAAGYNTFEKVAGANEVELRVTLERAGIKLAPAAASWPHQAALAARGEWEELKKLQDSLVGGRES